MSKLKLNLDDIKVESFETTQDQMGKGTVFGQLTWTATEEGNGTCVDCGGGGGSAASIDVMCTANPLAPTCNYYTCNQESCGGTCEQTCNADGGDQTCHYDCTYDSCAAFCTNDAICDILSRVAPACLPESLFNCTR